MASSLNHPHIVTVYDIGEFQELQYVVTECIDEGTLQARTLQIAAECVIVFRRDRIKLVIVAAGTGNRQAEEGFREGIGETRPMMTSRSCD